MRVIHRLPVDSPQKGPVTRKAFPLRDVITAFRRGYPLVEKIECFNWTIPLWKVKSLLTRVKWLKKNWDRDKRAAISQTTFSDAFSHTKSVLCWFKFDWSEFLMVQLIINQLCFRWWPGAERWLAITESNDNPLHRHIKVSIFDEFYTGIDYVCSMRA